MASVAPAGPDSEDKASSWRDALLAAACIAVDPAGLGGVRVRSAAGPVRDAWSAHWRTLVAPAPIRSVPLHVDDGRLFGGLDLPASLQAGRPVVQPGLLAEADGGHVVLAMAERIDPSTAARIGGVLERGGSGRGSPSRFGAIAFDEGDDDEALAATLDERLGLSIDLGNCSVRTLAGDDASNGATPATVARARAALATTVVGDDLVEALCAAADALGIGSLRMPLFALRTTRAVAALAGRDAATAADATVAARLVFAARARRLGAPATADEAAPPEAPDTSEPGPDAADPDDGDDATDSDAGPVPDRALDEVVLEAAIAAMPRGLLERLAQGAGGRHSGATRGSGAGAAARHGARGAPAGVRRGRPRAPQRLSLIDTLRAAAPWQRVRRAEPSTRPHRATVQVRAEDLHVVRFKQRHPTTTVFVVDASGSAALHRLAEAKGAVELLLADCYVRRDSVAVLAFRGRDAQLLLPPTRSLVRARRSLAALPGGGGTPLASALDATRTLVAGLRRRGDTVLVVLLTDGRANVARDGSGGRAKAEADAVTAAHALRAVDVDALLIDTSPQPHPQAARLAEAMGALYRPLPHAGAFEMSAVVNRAARRGA